LFLALAKPRFRRHIRETGFFHPFQRDNRQFLADFARSLIPADDRVLEYTLERMNALRRARRPYFLFCNLYDVHAPYPPSTRSILRSFRTLDGWVENLMFPKVMATLGAHTYLRPGFELSVRGQRLLRDRYHRAIELMDAKLAAFYHTARAARLFDDTLVILTSDHGEAFGEHGLYLHDASVWNTHLHVPLWISHPQRAAEVIDDVVSTRDLFGLMHTIPRGVSSAETLLDARFRARHPIALAEHYHYPHLVDADPRFRQNLAAAIGDGTKIVLHSGRVDRYDLTRDHDERSPQDGSLLDFSSECLRAGVHGPALETAMERLRSWQDEQSGRQPRAA
jgi:membrane-anchored protein YejM (alkaline phosphatase superfamily)